MAEKLEFDISVKNNDLQKALEKASTQASTLSSYFAGGQKPIQELTKEIDKASKATSFAADFMSNFKSQTLGVAAGQVVFNALAGAVSFVNETINNSIKAYTDQENAINKISQALRASNSYSEESVKSLDDYADSIEATTKFAGDAILTQIAFAKSLGATTEQAKQIVLAATNMSATLGGTLEENVDQLGKTLTGTAGRLAKYIPELKSLTEEQLKAGEAARIVNEKFGGAAVAELNTYTGRVENLKNVYGKLEEEIGRFLVKNSAIEVTQLALRDVFKSLAETIKSYNDGLQTNDTAKIGTAATTAANKITQLDIEIKQVQDDISKGFIGNALDPDAESIDSLRLQLKKLQEERSKLQETLPYLKDTKAQPEESKRIDEETVKQKEAIAKRNADILLLTQQAELEKQNFLAQSENLKINNEILSQSAEIERLNNFNIQKAEIEANSKIAMAEASLKGEDLKLEIQKINAEKELSLIKSNDEKKIALQKLNIKARQDGEKAWTDYEKKQAQEREANQRDSLSRIASLAGENNKTLAFIGKSAALTQIAIDGPQAVTKALAAFPPPFNFGAAAAVAAAVAVQAGKVAGVKFEDGGFVNGANGASVGPDNRIAQIRDGEMILNANDQKTLLNAIKNGNLGSGDIIVQVDGREIARAVRSQVQAGFRLA